MKSLCLILCTWICSSVSWFTIYGNLKRICILLLCKNCINLNNVELVHNAFQIYYILLLCLSILLIFESLILKVKVTQSCPTFVTPRTIHSPWNSPGQNTGVGSLSLLQGIFPTQESNWSPALQADSLPTELSGEPNSN